MTTISCPLCHSTTQTDAALADCPSCGSALPSSSSVEAPKQSVAGSASLGISATTSSGEESASELRALGITAKATPQGVVVQVADPQGAPPAAPPAGPAVVPVSTPIAPVSTPVAPVSTGTKVLSGVEIALDDIAAVAKLIAANFAGTPVAAVFQLLGPAAGIGAAVLAQHLKQQGFDLSALQPADIL